MSKSMIINSVKEKLKALKLRGLLTGIEQVDGDILKIFVDGDIFGYFSIDRCDFVSTEYDGLRSALESEELAV